MARHVRSEDLEDLLDDLGISETQRISTLLNAIDDGDDSDGVGEWDSEEDPEEDPEED